jgi:hypothetical protein
MVVASWRAEERTVRMRSVAVRISRQRVSPPRPSHISLRRGESRGGHGGNG